MNEVGLSVYELVNSMVSRDNDLNHKVTKILMLLVEFKGCFHFRYQVSYSNYLGTSQFELHGENQPEVSEFASLTFHLTLTLKSSLPKLIKYYSIQWYLYLTVQPPQ